MRLEQKTVSEERIAANHNNHIYVRAFLAAIMSAEAESETLFHL